MEGYPPEGPFLNEFVCHWAFKIDGDASEKKAVTLKKSDINMKDKMIDIVFDDEILVRANQTISIMVRFVDETSFLGMAMTQLGYNGDERYTNIRDNEPDSFII